MNPITFATFCAVIISILFQICLSSVVTQFSSKAEIEELFFKLRNKSRTSYDPFEYLRNEEHEKLCKSIFESNFFKDKNERFADKSDDVNHRFATSNSKLHGLNNVENNAIYTSAEALIKLSDGKVITSPMLPCLAMSEDSELKEYLVSWGFKANTYFLYVPQTSERYDGGKKSENETEFTQKSNVEFESIEEPVTDKGEPIVESKSIEKSVTDKVESNVESKSIVEPVTDKGEPIVESKSIEEPVTDKVESNVESKSIEEPVTDKGVPKVESKSIEKPVTNKVESNVESKSIVEPVIDKGEFNVESKSIPEPTTTEKLGIKFEEGNPVSNVNEENFERLIERINNGESGDYKEKSAVTDNRESSEKFGIKYEEGNPVSNVNEENFERLIERIKYESSFIKESEDLKIKPHPHIEVTFFALVELSPHLVPFSEVMNITEFFKKQKEHAEATNAFAVRHGLPSVTKNPICSFDYNEVLRLCALVFDVSSYKEKNVKLIEVTDTGCIQKESNVGVVDVIGCNVLENKEMYKYYIAHAFGVGNHAFLFSYDSLDDSLKLESYLTNIAIMSTDYVFSIY